MLKKDAVKFYGTEYKLAKALGIDRSAVNRWVKWVPMIRAAQLARLTSGKLKYDPEAYMDRA